MTIKNKYITIQRKLTYDVEEIRSSWAEMNNGVKLTDDEVFEIVMEWAQDDLADKEYGGMFTVTWEDEDGNEIT